MTAPRSKKRTPCSSEPKLTTKVFMKNQPKITQIIASRVDPSSAITARSARPSGARAEEMSMLRGVSIVNVG